jgi:outer membrane protein TolC
MRTKRLLYGAALAAAWVGLAGCSEIAAARRAQDPSTARPGERTVTAKQVGLVNGSSLTIEQGLEITLNYSPTVAIFRARVDEAEGTLEQVNAGYLPQVLLQADYRWEKAGGAGSTPLVGNRVTPNSGVVQTQGGSVSMNQLLYDFGKTNALSSQAVNVYLAAKMDLTSAQNDQAFNFRQAFFNLLKQEELVKVGEENVRQFEKHLEQTRVLVQVGSRQKYDLTKAEVDLGNAQLNLVKAKTALIVARATLDNALGLAEDPSYVAQKPKDVGQWTLTFDESFDLARKNHPKLEGLILRELAARFAIDAAIASFYPSLSLTGSFSWAGALTPTSWFGFLGPMLNYVVFSGWQVTGVLHQQVGSLREAYATRAQEEQQIYLDLRSAFAIFEDARESEKIALLTVKNATEQLDLAQGRYLAGKASSVDLTDAEVALANARAVEVQSRWDYEISIAALKRSVGQIQ